MFIPPVIWSFSLNGFGFDLVWPIPSWLSRSNRMKPSDQIYECASNVLASTCQRCVSMVFLGGINICWLTGRVEEWLNTWSHQMTNTKYPVVTTGSPGILKFWPEISQKATAISFCSWDPIMAKFAQRLFEECLSKRYPLNALTGDKPLGTSTGAATAL